MDDFNLKLILKSELKIKMASHLFRELMEETQISDKSTSKAEQIDLLFEEYSLEEIKELILNKYENNGDEKNHKRLIDRINGLTVDERRDLERKKEKEKRRKPLYSPSTDYEYRRYIAAYEIEDG